MTADYYDVVILGTEIGPLACAALLARRGSRVLVIGQGTPAPSYQAGSFRLPTRPFTLLGRGTPAVQRVLAELAMKQRVASLSAGTDASFQVALPGHRFEVSHDQGRIESESEREFPEVRRPIEDFHSNLARLSEVFGELCQRDLMWPPETFFERRDFAKASRALAFDKHGRGQDPLAELPERHPFRLVARAPARFADGMDPDTQTPLRLMRLYANWYRGSLGLRSGLPGLWDLLVDRIRTAGGVVRPGEQIDGVSFSRGAVTGVRVAASGTQIGCSYVIAGIDLVRLLPLMPERQLWEQLFERVGEPQPRYARFMLNLIVRPHGVPLGLSRDVFFVRDSSALLSGDNLLHVQHGPSLGNAGRLLCVEALLPRRHVEDDGYLQRFRERLIESLSDLVPFLRMHLLAMDSPHDGRPPTDCVTGRDLACPQPWTRGRRSMPIVYGYPAARALGLCAVPVRAPIKRLLLCNEQVVPGLGLEGTMLAAWSAARVVTRADKKPRWVRRSMWAKAEA